VVPEVALDRLQDLAVVVDGEENWLQGNSRAVGDV
jgi:hypothetical protein